MPVLANGTLQKQKRNYITEIVVGDLKP